MDLRQIEWCGVDWIDLAWDRDQWKAFVNTVMNLQVPWNFVEFLNSCTTGSFSKALCCMEWFGYIVCRCLPGSRYSSRSERRVAEPGCEPANFRKQSGVATRSNTTLGYGTLMYGRIKASSILCMIERLAYWSGPILVQPEIVVRQNKMENRPLFSLCRRYAGCTQQRIFLMMRWQMHGAPGPCKTCVIRGKIAPVRMWEWMYTPQN
jgi:hypothetical protein